MNNSYNFPYSEDLETKKIEILDNLEKGLLLEDKDVFIPWSTTYNEIDFYAEHKIDSGDRTNWFLGQHQILGGLITNISVFKWADVNSNNSFSQIDDFLGFDDDGNAKFIMFKAHFINLLGEPSYYKLEEFEPNQFLGSIEWTYKNIRIYLTGFEQFAHKYRITIGLKKN
jgi:hypothetical protein